MFLFDTYILSEVIKKKPNPSLMERLAGIAGNLQFTSCICVMELRYGARKRPDFERLWNRIELELLEAVTILPVMEETALTAGDIAAALSRDGFAISPEDLLIAATALENNLTLVTANIKHFNRVPKLKLENWIA